VKAAAANSPRAIILSCVIKVSPPLGTGMGDHNSPLRLCRLIPGSECWRPWPESSPVSRGAGGVISTRHTTSRGILEALANIAYGFWKGQGYRGTAHDTKRRATLRIPPGSRRRWDKHVSQTTIVGTFCKLVKLRSETLAPQGNRWLRSDSEEG